MIVLQVCVIAQMAAFWINKANGHRISLEYRTAIAIPQMPVIDIVQAPKAEVHAIVAVDRHKVATIKHPRPGAKYSANNGRAMQIARKESNKG